MIKTKCSGCGQDEAGTKIIFALNSPEGEPFPVNEQQAKRMKHHREFYLCENCVRQGKFPVLLWVIVALANLVVFFAARALPIFMSKPGRNMPAIGGITILLLCFFWFAMLISGSMLVVKARLKNMQTAVFVILQMSPIISLLSLLTIARRINAQARAVQVLKPLVKKRLQEEMEREREIERRVEQGEELEGEMLRQYEIRQTEKKEFESQQVKQAEGARRGNIMYALLGMAFTILIALQGKDLYGTGRGYFKFFGIRLSSSGFTLLLLAFIAYDILALVSALRKK